MTDWEARRALAETLVREHLTTHRLTYLGNSLDDAIYQLYIDAGAPYGDDWPGVQLWLDDKLAARRAAPQEHTP